MNWKLNMLLLKGIKSNVNTSAIVNLLAMYNGMEKYQLVGHTTLDKCLNPANDNLYIGRFNNTFIITESNLPKVFYNDPPNKIEELMLGLTRNNNEMLSLVLDNSKYLWGYAFIKNQDKIKCKLASQDKGVIIDGESQEDTDNELLQKLKIIDKGYLEGESKVFTLMDSFINTRLDTSSELLDIKMSVYGSRTDQAIEEIVDEVVGHLNTKSHIFSDLINPAISYMETRSDEVKANTINFWRNPESRNLRMEITHLENDEEEIYDCSHNCDLLTDCDKIFNPRDLYDFSNKFGDNGKLMIRLEKEFLNWFISNWYKINGQRLKNTYQTIIENSSALGFDLNSMNYDQVIWNYQNQYKYSHELTEPEILQRLNVYQVVTNHTNSITRTLTKDKKTVTIEIKHGKLLHTNLPTDLVTLINKINSPSNKYDLLKTMSQIIDILIENNYREI